MDSDTFREWFATGVMVLVIAIVIGTLVYCMKRSPRDE